MSTFNHKNRDKLDAIAEYAIKLIVTKDENVPEIYSENSNRYRYNECIVKGWGIFSGFLGSKGIDSTGREYLLTTIKKELTANVPHLYADITSLSHALSGYHDLDDYPLKVGEWFSMQILNCLDAQLVMLGTGFFMNSLEFAIQAIEIY